LALRRPGDDIWLDGDAPLDAPAVTARLLACLNPAGSFVQPRLFNTPAMAAIKSGRGLCATRFINALTTDGLEIIAVIQRTLGREAIAGNFSGGMTANLICRVDAGSGRLGVAHGCSNGQRLVLTRYDHHPSTGEPFLGFQLPHW
jgi:hypothetical protein